MLLVNTFKKILPLVCISVFFLNCSPLQVATVNSATRNSGEELIIHFIDVGQGDSTFIALPGGENILIDTGSPAGGLKVARYLKDLGVRRIDYVILTHPHDDHIGGIFSVNAEFSLGSFYDNGFSNFKSSMYGDYLRLVRDDLTKYSVLQSGETLIFGDVRIDILNPVIPPTGDLNEDSVVLRIKFIDFSILLSGDMGKTGERRLLNTGADLKSGLIKIGHHGDNGAGSAGFLKSVGPETAIISVGRINKYARPHLELLDRLKRAGAKIYRTDLHGHIILNTDGRSYEINTLKGFKD